MMEGKNAPIAAMKKTKLMNKLTPNKIPITIQFGFRMMVSYFSALSKSLLMSRWKSHVR